MLNEGRPRLLINMPGLMARSVVVMDTSGQMVPDRTWHLRTRAVIESLYQFLLQYGLIDGGHQDDDIDGLMLYDNQLSPSGLALWTTGTVNRWIGSFDRNPGKSLQDYRMLVKQLERDSDSRC